MKDLIKSIGILAIAALCLTAFFAFAGEPDVCYAERPCKEGNVSCMVSGPGCDAEVTDDGVACVGNNEQGRWVSFVEKCQ